ncbi:head-tail connector protein [Sporolactobacillus terrae]|uniref:Phage gp6-like head-tail connector protein n=1 Tax=Sporolactobacillus terrae TaxID=269673 RepID=A0ABX5Q749_9BACL|nr:head-tail connector protein [Sporolactobacillus terrae]QAA22466.1 phage gp6-like head-tail connector protein [Sporolactobacillus terrae]QAA25440.1 phage gp6-like head-tail connector protein [Sporolactobacillus terrae]UAK17250.1 head-tail connector protein [Sporolactobacillus terrae]
MSDTLSTPITELNIDLIKTYLRVDYNDDDALLQNMLDAARSTIQTFLNRPYTDFDPVPQEFTIAALSLIGTWYNHREIYSEQSRGQEPLPLMYQAILSPFRVWAMGD